MGSSSLALSFICAVSLAMVRIGASQHEPGDWIKAHNAAREVVRNPPIQWNTTLVDYAGSYLNLTTRDCRFMASNGPYGENSMIVEKASTTPAEIVAVWMKEKAYYDSSKNICIKPCHHYTQVIWKSSLQLGCVRSQCKNGGPFFVLCSYYPKGNIPGQRPY